MGKILVNVGNGIRTRIPGTNTRGGKSLKARHFTTSTAPKRKVGKRDRDISPKDSERLKTKDKERGTEREKGGETESESRAREEKKKGIIVANARGEGKEESIKAKMGVIGCDARKTPQE